MNDTLTGILFLALIAAMYYWACQEPKPPKVRLYSFKDEDGEIGIASINELEAVRFVANLFDMSETDVFMSYRIREVPRKNWNHVIVYDMEGFLDKNNQDPEKATIAELMDCWVRPDGKKLTMKAPDIIYSTFDL